MKLLFYIPFYIGREKRKRVPILREGKGTQRKEFCRLPFLTARIAVLKVPLLDDLFEKK